jgi:hypothetical protein
MPEILRIAMIIPATGAALVALFWLFERMRDWSSKALTLVVVVGLSLLALFGLRVL